MTHLDINESQRTAARVVGFSYLLAMVAATFDQFFVIGRLIVPDNAADTIHNIIAHERLFRLGIAGMYLNFLTDVALIAALYVILSRVNKPLAMFAAFMRIVETSTGIAALLYQFYVLRFLSGAPYLKVFPTDQVQALARVPMTVFGAGFNACFVAFGIGSAVFGYLWFKSGYIPRALAALGVFGSLLVAATTFAVIVLPELQNDAELLLFVPIGVFEITMGFWLLLKGLPPSSPVPGSGSATL